MLVLFLVKQSVFKYKEGQEKDHSFIWGVAIVNPGKE